MATKMKAATWADLLRQLRDRSGLTQRQLCAKVKVSQQLVSAWENGDAVPNVDVAMRVLAVLSATEDDYLALRGLGRGKGRTRRRAWFAESFGETFGHVTADQRRLLPA